MGSWPREPTAGRSIPLLLRDQRTAGTPRRSIIADQRTAAHCWPREPTAGRDISRNRTASAEDGPPGFREWTAAAPRTLESDRRPQEPIAGRQHRCLRIARRTERIKDNNSASRDRPPGARCPAAVHTGERPDGKRGPSCPGGARDL